MRDQPLPSLPFAGFLAPEPDVAPPPLALSTAPMLDDTVARALAGDATAVATLYDALVGPIHRYVAMRVRSREDAEDITQAVFERIVTSLPRYRDRGRPFTAFAFTVARNAVIDHVRRTRHHEPLDLEVGDEAVGLEALSLHDEEVRELRAALRHLTPEQQEAIALRYGAGLSAEEAGIAMGRSANTVRALTFRGVGALRRRMAAPPA